MKTKKPTSLSRREAKYAKMKRTVRFQKFTNKKRRVNLSSQDNLLLKTKTKRMCDTSTTQTIDVNFNERGLDQTT